MTRALQVPIATSAVGILIIAGLGSYQVGAAAALSILYALLVSGISLLSIIMLTNAFGKRARAPRAGVVLTLLLFAAKMPLLLLLIYLAMRQPMAGIYCFLATVGLVYSCFAWFVHSART